MRKIEFTKSDYITENEVFNFLYDIKNLHNRCYIHRPYKGCLYIVFEADIELNDIIQSFASYCYHIGKIHPNVDIEHREYIRGQFITNRDYMITFTSNTEFMLD